MAERSREDENTRALESLLTTGEVTWWLAGERPLLYVDGFIPLDKLEQAAECLKRMAARPENPNG